MPAGPAGGACPRQGFMFNIYVFCGNPGRKSTCVTDAYLVYNLCNAEVLHRLKVLLWQEARAIAES